MGAPLSASQRPHAGVAAQPPLQVGHMPCWGHTQAHLPAACCWSRGTALTAWLLTNGRIPVSAAPPHLIQCQAGAPQPAQAKSNRQQRVRLACLPSSTAQCARLCPHPWNSAGDSWGCQGREGSVWPLQSAGGMQASGSHAVQWAMGWASPKPRHLHPQPRRQPWHMDTQTALTTPALPMPAYSLRHACVLPCTHPQPPACIDTHPYSTHTSIYAQHD